MDIKEIFKLNKWKLLIWLILLALFIYQSYQDSWGPYYLTGICPEGEPDCFNTPPPEFQQNQFILLSVISIIISYILAIIIYYLLAAIIKYLKPIKISYKKLVKNSSSIRKINCS